VPVVLDLDDQVVADRHRRQPQVGPLGLLAGATILGALETVVDGVADDVNQLGPQAAPVLGVEAQAARFDPSRARSGCSGNQR
jgi:hypothetical protein